MHHCILSAFLCFPHVYPLGGILVFSRVILTRVYVLRMLYTFCIHDAALAILIIIAERLSARLMIAHYIDSRDEYIYIYVCNASAHALRMRRIIIITRYTHQRRCLAQTIATKGSCMPNLRGIHHGDPLHAQLICERSELSN